MLRTLLVVMCLVLGSGAVNAGWFGPDSEQECVRKYEHKIKDKLTKTMVLDGCSNLFTKGLKRVGKCKIENMDRVKSGDGLVLLAIGCVGMYNKKSKFNKQGSKCVVDYLSTVMNEDDFIHVTKEKCGMRLRKKVSTTTTENGTTTTTTTTTNWVLDKR